MSFLSIHDLDCEGKRVLVRADLNVPMEQTRITDDSRIKATLPTLQALLRRGARVLVTSHLGRPTAHEAEFSLKPVADYLQQLLPGVEVLFSDDCVGPTAEEKSHNLKAGQLLVLENVRYHKAEEKNEEKFARELAKVADFYVNDAFATSHRAHASVEAITRLLPSAAGLLMEQELWALSRALENPDRPVMAIIGGAKVSTKLTLLKNLARKVDVMFLGGGMATTVMYAQGIQVGKSLCEKELVNDVKQLLQAAQESKCEIVLPLDFKVAKEFKSATPSEVVNADAIPSDSMSLDVGPRTVEDIIRRLQNVKTVVWNGPIGAFELKGFEQGTHDAAHEVAQLTASGKLLSVAGGGDTLAALAQLIPHEQFTFVSTAGGAFLEWLEGRVLPGVAALGDVFKRTEQMLVLKTKDIMTTSVVSVRDDATVGDVQQLMESKNVRHIPVVDDQGAFVGLLSQRDVFRLLPSSLTPNESEKKKVLQTKVADVMNRDVVTGGLELTVKAAAHLMATHKYGCLPIVGHGRNDLVGIITENDFVKVVGQLLTQAEGVQRTVYDALKKPSK